MIYLVMIIVLIKINSLQKTVWPVSLRNIVYAIYIYLINFFWLNLKITTVAYIHVYTSQRTVHLAT